MNYVIGKTFVFNKIASSKKKKKIGFTKNSNLNGGVFQNTYFFFDYVKNLSMKIVYIFQNVRCSRFEIMVFKV